jgi:TfoX/Sxy family transcriptional regulator of competence genes
VAFDEELASRIRALVVGEPGVTERKMFGGLAFLIDGNMSVAASREGGLMVRVDPDAGEGLVESSGAVPVVMRGRAMQGWLRVEAADVRADDELARWVGVGVAFARSLPPKR